MKFSLFTLFSKKLGPMKCPIFGSKGTWSPAKGYGGIDLVKLICSVDRVPWPTPGDTVVLAGNREVWQWEEVKAATGQLTSVLRSAELKAPVSFSDRLLSVVLPSIILETFHIFMLFSRTIKPISTKLGTKHPWVKRI